MPHPREDDRDREAGRTAEPATPRRDGDDTTCPRCAESRDLAKIKGCITCLACGFKFDCNGW
jgi:hypothetical protein